MNSRRRADLHRRLSMGTVPRPPEGLLERIKGDIPSHLHAVPEREQATRSFALSLRVAASIITLILTAIVTRELLEPEQQSGFRPQKRAEKVVRAIETSPPVAGTAVAAAPTQSVSLEESAPVMTVQTDGVRRSVNSDPIVLRDADAEDDRTDTPVTSIVAGEVAGDRAIFAPAPAPVAEAELWQMAELERQRPAAAVAAPPPSPALQAEAVKPQARERAERVSAAAAAPAFAKTVAGARDAVEGKKDVFGLSNDPDVFDKIRNALENGVRPAVAAADVDALVNYFAGRPDRAPRNDVTLEVEASSAPVATDRPRAMLRFTVDTADRRTTEGGRSTLIVVATNARIEIEIDSSAVDSFRRIGGSEDIATAPQLTNNLSVTGLYELNLDPNVHPTQRVATVRLHYTDSEGRGQTITRLIRGRDVKKDWSQASRRHRLSSLGAVWSETVRGTAGAAEIARRAEELSAQEPSDRRAKELATAASATVSGGR